MGDITTALTTGFTAASSSIMDIIGVVLPIALGIVGTIIAVKFGVRFFKGIAK